MGDTQKIRIKKPTQTGSLLWMLIPVALELLVLIVYSVWKKGRAAAD